MQVSEEIDGKITKKLFQEFSRTESRILGALSKLDEFPLSPQVRISSVTVPGRPRNINSENGEPTGDRSLNDPYPELVFSACHTSKLNDSEQEETHHSGRQDEVTWKDITFVFQDTDQLLSSKFANFSSSFIFLL